MTTKSILAAVLAGLVSWSAAAAVINVVTGSSPNDHTGDTLQAAFNKVNNNFAFVEGQFGALPDAQTNSILNSGRKVAFTTNSFTITYNTSNWLAVVVTNFAGMDYGIKQGQPTPLVSYDFGATWQNSERMANLVTNVPVMVGWRVQGFPPSSSFYFPIDGIVTNVVIYSLARGDLYGRTNQVYGEHLMGSDPVFPSEFATKNYVDGAVNANDRWSAPVPMWLNGNALNWSSAWQSAVDATTNADRFHLSFLGQDVFTIQQPSGQIVGVSISLSGTNCTVKVPTNGLTGPFSLKATRYINPASWIWLGNGLAMVCGTNYVLTFSQPWNDSGYFLAVVPSTAPAVLSLAAVLRLSPRTITNSTDSTWGYGAGLVASDASYLYISTATNAWKRVALSGW